MKIKFKYEKGWVEILPSIGYGWHGQNALYIGWLFWNAIIDF